jgi:hypothetical protein
LRALSLAGTLLVGVSVLTGCNQGTTAAAGGPTATAPPAASSAPPPSPSTGSATLSWLAPTTNTDGTALTDLAGYRIYYGTSASALSDTVPLGLGVQTYVIGSLGPGTWYFAVRAITSTGVESALSDTVSKTIG